jgi:hypothetical protein
VKARIMTESGNVILLPPVLISGRGIDCTTGFGFSLQAVASRANRRIEYRFMSF